MKRRISVHLGSQERLIGEIRYDRQGSRESAAFAYDAAWLAAADRFAIEPALPLVAGFQFRQRTGGTAAGGCPRPSTSIRFRTASGS